MAGTLRVDNTGGSQDSNLRRVNPINSAPPPAVLPAVVIDPSTLAHGHSTDFIDYLLPAGNYAVSVRMADGSFQYFGNQANPTVITDGNTTPVALV